MTFSSDAIANAFLETAERKGASLTPMKLQKLAYFSHGWCLALQDEPFVNEPIQAWKYGPVIYSLYREFKEFGDSAITRRAHDVRVRNGEIIKSDPSFRSETDDPGAYEYAEALVDRVWELYGQYDAVQLSNMTHRTGTPWRQIWDAFDGEIPRGITIPDELIAEYFKLMLKPGKTHT